MADNNTYGIIPKEQAEQILKRIGSLVKTHRQQKQWSMAQLAEQSGTSSSLISDLENNKGKVPSMFTLMSIARALNIPDDGLIKIFISFNKTARELPDSAEISLRNLLLGFNVPTNAVNDIVILLNMISMIGNMYHKKNEKVIAKNLPTFDEQSIVYMNELVNLYSQYNGKTNNKS